jgi:phosphonate transport system ATP-binding protein
MSTRLRLEGLRKVWPDGKAGLDLADTSLEVAGGEVVAVLGGSGAGKSTLLRCASRLIEPTAGRCWVGDTELTALSGRALARARGQVGFVFQQFNLVRSYSALDNVLVARARHVSWLRGLVGLWPAADVALARRCLDEVGLDAKHDSLARELSGGQQQRVAIARAFAQEPACLFADEPTASLDPNLAAVVLDLLRGYGRRHAVPVLLNVHTLDHARRYADRVWGLRAGKLVHDGPASALTETVVDHIYGASAARAAETEPGP